MTVNQLHKLLSNIIARGEGRLSIYIDKTTFKHPCEADGCVILPVNNLDVDAILQMDDDGGSKTNAKGEEVYRRGVVVKGGDR